LFVFLIKNTKDFFDIAGLMHFYKVEVKVEKELYLTLTSAFIILVFSLAFLTNH